MSDKTELLEIDRSLMNGLNTTGRTLIITPIGFPEEIERTIHDKINFLLSKRKSSALTKNVSRLLRTNKVSFGLSSEINLDGTSSHDGVISNTNNKLHSIVVNLSYCVNDGLNVSTFIKDYMSNVFLINQLESETRVIYDIQKVDRIKKLKDETYSKILEVLNYDTMIDVIFRLYVAFLIDVSFRQSKQMREKFPELLLMSYQSFIVGMLKRLNITLEQQTDRHLVVLSIYYSFFTQYSTLTNHRIMLGIEKTFKDRIDVHVINHFKTLNAITLKDKSSRGFKTLPILLTNSKIVKLNWETIEELFNRLYGKELMLNVFKGLIKLLSVLATSDKIIFARGIENMSNEILQKALNAKKFVSI